MISKTLKSFRRRLWLWKNDALKRAFSSPGGKRNHLRAMADDIVEITKQFDTHILSFSPKGRYIERDLYAIDGYQREDTKIVLEMVAKTIPLSKRAIVLEFGGNIGTQTIYFGLSKLFKKIITIEPDAENLKFLSKNVSANNMKDLVDIVPVALTNYDGDIIFYKSATNSGGHSLIYQEQDENVRVPCQCLATIIKEHNINFDDVVLIWSDLEGADYQAFLQARAIKLPPAYYLEFSPNLMRSPEAEKFKQEIYAAYDSVLCFQGGKLLPIAHEDIPQNKQTDLLLLDPR